MNHNIEYIEHGDYLLPAIKMMPLPTQEKEMPLGRYARLHKAYLKEHKPVTYSRLLLTGKLYPLLWELDEAAQTRLDTIGNRDIADEVILTELVYN